MPVSAYYKRPTGKTEGEWSFDSRIFYMQQHDTNIQEEIMQKVEKIVRWEARRLAIQNSPQEDLLRTSTAFFGFFFQILTDSCRIASLKQKMHCNQWRNLYKCSNFIQLFAFQSIVQDLWGDLICTGLIKHSWFDIVKSAKMSSSCWREIKNIQYFERTIVRYYRYQEENKKIPKCLTGL